MPGAFLTADQRPRSECSVGEPSEVGQPCTPIEFGVMYLEIDAVVEQETDSPQIPIGYFQQALELQKKFADRAWQGRTLSRIGLLYTKQGETEKALEAYLQALSFHQTVNYHAGLSTTLGFIANLFSKAGKDIWAQDLEREAKNKHAHYAQSEFLFKQGLHAEDI